MMTPFDKQMADLYGAMPKFSEHHVSDHIAYRMEGRTYTGTILWVAAASIGSRGQRLHAYYVVSRDGLPNSFPDFVFFNDVVVK